MLNRSDNYTSVSVISVVNIDALHDYLIFFFLDMPFQTRKAEDFYLWCITLFFHKLGYFYISEGRVLIYKISLYINKARYSTNVNRATSPSLSYINKVLDINLPVRLEPHMLHVDLAKIYARKFEQHTIWIYDNGKLLSEKPYTSFTSAMVAIGYSKNSIAARRSIDTGKIIGGRYTFYSKPL